MVDQVALMRKMEESQEFSDNWDDDFADGISLTKLNGESTFQPISLSLRSSKTNETRRTFEADRDLSFFLSSLFVLSPRSRLW